VNPALLALALAAGAPPAGAPAPPEPGLRATAAERRVLSRILEEPRFRPVRGEAVPLLLWLERLWDWLVERLGTTEAEAWATGGRALFFAAVAAAAAALGLTALRGRLRRSRRRAPARATPEAPPPEAPEEALRGDDPAEAVRAAFLLALGALERSRALPPGRALTNREMAARVAETAPAAAEDFARLAAALDRLLYGGGRPQANEARACVSAARRAAAAAAGGRA
jgi:hypothetical protein